MIWQEKSTVCLKTRMMIKDKKVLYLYSYNLKPPLMSGGAVLTNRNLDNFKAILGEENLIVNNLDLRQSVKENACQKICRWVRFVLQGYNADLTSDKLFSIFRTIEKEKISVIILDLSLWGKLNRAIKKKFSKIEVITHFHNIELHFLLCHIKAERKYFRIDLILSFFLNERNSCRHSDKVIVLNSRDAYYLKKYYKRNDPYIVPVSINDEFELKRYELAVPTEKFSILFVGSLFFANIQGITWFVDEVMLSFPDIILNVVGKNLNEVRHRLERKNVKVFSDVPCIKDFYYNANLVVMPIFTGGGMKVKTAEALMYGKTIIGTPEAFCGYKYNSGIGKICTNKKEFCEAINYYLIHKDNKYNNSSRELYLEKYSYGASLHLFEKILLGNNQ